MTPLRSPRDRLRLALATCAVLLVLLPLLVGLLDELRARAAHAPMSGDFALLELGVHRVLHGGQLFGPYSRFAFHHPGPLYLYLLAPLYRLSGESSSSIFVGAALLAVAAAATIVLVGRRVVRGPLAQAVGLALLVIGIAWYVETPHTRGPSWPWNPSVTVLPFVAFLLLAARSSAPGRGSLPLLFFLHAFLVQTHLGNAPVATAVLVLALVLRFGALVARRGRGRVTRSSSLLPTVLVALVAWLPTLVEQLRDRPGNLVQLWRFFRGDEGQNPLGATVDYTTWHLTSAVPWWRITLPTARVVVVLLESSLVATAAFAWRRRRHDAARLSLVVAVAVPVAYLASSRIRGELFPHLATSFPLLALLGVAAVVSCVVPRRLDASLGAPIVGFGAASALALSFAVHDVVAMRKFLDDEVVRPDSDAAAIRDLEAILRPALAKVGDRPVLISTRAHATWGVLAGLVLALEKDGIVPVVEPRWRFMYEDSVRYADATPVEIWLSDERVIEGEPIYLGARFSAFVHRSSPLYGRAKVVSATGTHGDPALLVDGLATPGAPWDGKGSLVIDASGAVVLDVRAADETGRVSGLRITADGNDAYRVEGSIDGRTFVEIGVLPSVPVWGMAERDVTFADGPAWTQVRISPLPSDGFYALSEVRPLLARRLVQAVDFGTPNARAMLGTGWSIDEHDAATGWVWALGEEARCVVPLRAGQDYEASFALAPVPIEGPSQTVEVRASGVYVTTLILQPGDGSYSALLPASGVKARTELTFRFGHWAIPHEIDPTHRDRRRLAVAFFRMSFTPSGPAAPDLE